MSITRVSVLAAVLLVSTPCCAGLFPAPANRHELVTFDHVTIPNSGRINCIVRDARGFLWLGTVPLTNGLIAQVFGVKYLSTLGGSAFLFHQIGSFAGIWIAGLGLIVLSRAVLEMAAEPARR